MIKSKKIVGVKLSIEDIEEVTGVADDTQTPFKYTKHVPHAHTKHNIGMRLSGPAPSGLEINNVQVWLCPLCKLLWFDELPNTMPRLNNNGRFGD
jgi:hypothetical protein